MKNHNLGQCNYKTTKNWMIYHTCSSDTALSAS